MSTKSESGGHYVERLGIDNLSDLEKLYTAVYEKLPQPNFFSLKYDTNFTAVNYTGFIAYSTTQLPIAYYGVIPCFMRFKDKIVLAAQSADTMTHPHYRNRGLFVELAERTCQLCREVGVQIIFGFPNQNSLPGFINKLGWQMTERMDCFIIKASFFSWQRVFRKLTVFDKIYKKYRERQIQQYLLPKQGIDNSVFTDGCAGVYRDHQYLKYKTYSSTRVIGIGRSTLWIKINNELVIGDVSVAPDDFDELMSKVKRLTGKLGLKEIHFHTSPGTTLHTLFSGRFSSIPSFPVIFKDLAGLTAIDKIKFTTADIDTF